ncbi:hypothetical protein ACT29H_09925 [Thermophagus sp. OGC60D27]|uniref:hypothetical protein n=1 Tax=Thermophagus sp. OGC60D27 TaxID=3458415 RepID=UPI0040380098
MDKRQANKFNMFKVVRDFLSDHSATLGQYLHFSEMLEKFSSLLSSIGELDSHAVTKTSGLTQEKAAARERLIKATMLVVRILKAYATFSDNESLLENIDFTLSSLSRISEQKLLARAQKVIQEAEACLTEAEPYGLTTEKMDELTAAFKEFDERQSTIRKAIVVRKNISEQVEALMEEADDLLKDKIDIILELASNDHPELYNQYLGAREIIDR